MHTIGVKHDGYHLQIGVVNLTGTVVYSMNRSIETDVSIFLEEYLPAVMPIVGIVTLLIYVGDFTQFDIVYAMTTTSGNPRFRTDLFGSLFYQTAFSTPARGGWGMGMGAAVSTIMFFVVAVGVIVWFFIFQRKRDT